MCTVCVYSHLMLSSFKSLILKKNSFLVWWNICVFLFSHRGGNSTSAHNKQWSVYVDSDVLYYFLRFYICLKIINKWFVSSTFSSEFMDFIMLKECVHYFKLLNVQKSIRFLPLLFDESSPFVHTMLVISLFTTLAFMTPINIMASFLPTDRPRYSFSGLA
jgi:hypothetical protein